MILICIHVTVQNMVILNKNVIICIMSVILLYLFKQRSHLIFLPTRIMVDAAKFNSHDSGGHFQKSTFKNGRCKKYSNIFVTKFKLQVRFSIQLLHREYTSYITKIWKYLKRNWGMRLKLSSAHLSIKVFLNSKKIYSYVLFF